MIGISLEPGEEVVWQSVINRWIIGLHFVLFLIPILALGCWGLMQDSVGFSQCSGRYVIDRTACTVLHPDVYVNGAIFGLVVIGVGLILLLINFIWQFTQEYTITSKRVIIKSLLSRINYYRSVYFKDIKGVVNAQGWLGRRFGFGTIKIDIGEKYSGMSRNMIRYVNLTNINTPDEVYQYINSTIAKAKESPIQQNPQ